jgi:phage terminase large subunit-like protein
LRPDIVTAKAIIANLAIGTLGKWAGKPVELLPWQEEILQAICATGEDGQRLYDTIWIEISRKAGKTMFCSFIGICAMLMETNPQVVLAAANREQAHILFQYIYDQIHINPKLAKYLQPYRHEIRLASGKPGVLKTLAADGGSNHGLNPSLILVDEVHAIPETKVRPLLEALDTARGARNSLMIYITTAGSAFTYAHSLHQRALKIEAGEMDDPGFKSFIYAADETDDPGNPETWYKANPSLGVTIDEKWYKKQYERARTDAQLMASFRKLQLNMWSGSSQPFIEVEHWRKWSNAPDGWEHWPCVMGVDLSSVNDWEAYVLIFYNDGQLFVKPFFQIPATTWEVRTEHYGPQTADWVAKGFVNVVPHPVHTDESRLEMIYHLMQTYDVRHIGFDPWNARKVSDTINEQYGEEFAVAVRQGVAHMNEPMKETYKRGMEGKISHDGNPVMENHVAAVVLESDKNGNWWVAKDKATEKIDGVAALVTAMAVVMFFEQEDYYANHDISFG